MKSFTPSGYCIQLATEILEALDFQKSRAYLLEVLKDADVLRALAVVGDELNFVGIVVSDGVLMYQDGDVRVILTDEIVDGLSARTCARALREITEALEKLRHS